MEDLEPIEAPRDGGFHEAAAFAGLLALFIVQLSALGILQVPQILFSHLPFGIVSHALSC
jgi:hypothetical protein